MAAEMGIPGCLAHSHTVHGLVSLTLYKSARRLSEGSGLMGRFVGQISQILCACSHHAALASVPVRVWMGRKWGVSGDTAGRRVFSLPLFVSTAKCWPRSTEQPRPPTNGLVCSIYVLWPSNKWRIHHLYKISLTCWTVIWMSNCCCYVYAALNRTTILTLSCYIFSYTDIHLTMTIVNKCR